MLISSSRRAHYPNKSISVMQDNQGISAPPDGSHSPPNATRTSVRGNSQVQGLSLQGHSENRLNKPNPRTVSLWGKMPANRHLLF